MTDESDRIYKDTMQEVMLELKIKTDEVMKKFKEELKKNKVKHSGH